MKGSLGHSLESERLERWMALLAGMEPADAPAVAAMLRDEKAVGHLFGIETMMFWQTWGRVDPKGAWAYVQEHPEEAGKEGVNSLLKSWAFKDPAGARAAFEELGDSPLRAAALSGLGHGLAESDPAAAVAFASGLPNGQQTEAAVHISGSIIYTMGNEGAQAWFDKLPADSPAFNKESARVLMEALSRSDPGSVEKFAFARLDQEWSARPAEQNFAASMIARNGGSPWEYVSKVMEKYPRPEEPLAFTAWVANLDPQSAIAWADANPNDHATDAILAGTAQVYLKHGKPDEAAALLERVKDPAMRGLAGGQ